MKRTKLEGGGEKLEDREVDIGGKRTDPKQKFKLGPSS